MWRPVALVLVLLVAAAGCSIRPLPTGYGQTTTAAVTDNGDGSADLGFDPRDIQPVVSNPEPVLPVTVHSADGPEVTVTSIDRIIAVNLSGSLAEIVFTLGLGDHVVGRDISSTFYAAEHLPVVTQGHDLATEPILALNPTLILVDGSVGPPEVIDQIRAAGVAVVVIDEAWSLDGIAPRISAVATALGVPGVGMQLNARTEKQVSAALASAPKDHEKLRVAFLYVRGTAGVYLIAGDGSGADSMIEAIGAEDAGTAIGLKKFRPLTSEGLINAAPDVILVMNEGLTSVGGIDGLLKLPGVAQTPAGANRRVVAMDDSALLSFGPRTGEMVQALARAVYRTGT
ncbi:ABC transporter substrate-binding protein [Nakamurella silvestris]|nr:ABC transporter substrate-binding protein [Nakamurella silvestris]